jgi:WD40 repeat protein
LHTSLFYAGSKNGQVKAFNSKNERIELVGGIMAHSQAVNAVCTLDENPYSLITASQDKTIKIWQPTKDTIESINR